MRVELTDIDQRLSLQTGSMTTFLVFTLPSGGRVRTAIDEDEAARIISEFSGAPIEEEPEVMGTVHVDPEADWGFKPGESPQVVLPPIEAKVDWTQLTDTQLPPSMRQIFEASGVETVLSVSDFETLKGKVLDKLSGSGKPQPGEVVWDQGPQRRAQSRSRRTVPMDEAGNPLPPGGIVETDPGETQDDDDDGVSQL